MSEVQRQCERCRSWFWNYDDGFICVSCRSKGNQMCGNCESLTARLAAAEAENERLRGNGQFVVHTGDDLEYYDTEKEAIEAAQRAIYDLSEDSESGWPAIVENVKVMHVVHAVKRFDHVDDFGVPFTLYSIAEEGVES